jgi:HEAT repeat protein
MVQPTAPAEDALTAIEILHACRLPATEEALRRALDHKDLDVQAAACRALGEVGDMTALPRLEKASISAECTVASAAIEAVTRLRKGDPEWRERLLRMTHAQRPEIRLAAADSLASLADPTLLPTLVALLDDRDWRVREAAAEGLGGLRQKEAVGPLIDHLEKDRFRVRDSIAIALRRTTGMPFDESRTSWRRWWVDHGAAFTVPPLADVEAMEARLAKARASNTTKATFYGIPVTSDHVTVVVDISGSMAEPAHCDGAAVSGVPGSDAAGPTKLDVAKAECTKLIEQMPDGAQLNLLFFSDGVERWQHGVIELDRPRVARATMFVRDRHAGGATNLYEALAQALSDSETDAIYLLTDGEPTAGKIVDPALLRADVHHRNHARRVRIHSIALGHSSALLNHLSEDSGGTYAER